MGSLMSEIVIITIWAIPPPPMPCTPRHSTNQIKLCAAPHIAEPNRNKPMLAKRIGFLPTISESFPYNGLMTADTSGETRQYEK